MPARVKLYSLIIAVITAASIYVNSITAFRYRWWNLLALTVAILTLRFLFYRAFTSQEKEYIRNSNRITPWTWALLLIALSLVITALAV